MGSNRIRRERIYAAFGFGLPDEGRVEQEADDSWVAGRYAEAGERFRPRRAAAGPFFRAFGPEIISSPDHSGLFPETNFFAGARQMAGCACVLKG